MGRELFQHARAIGAGYGLGNHRTTTSISRRFLHGMSARGPTGGERDRPRDRAMSAAAPPFPPGARNAATIELANELGYGSISRTVDTLGWQGTDAGRSAASVGARVLGAVEPGAIVLMLVGARRVDPRRGRAAAPSLGNPLPRVPARGRRQLHPLKPRGSDLTSTWEPSAFGPVADQPQLKGRVPLENVSIANSDSGAMAYTHGAIAEGYRAIQDLPG